MTIDSWRLLQGVLHDGLLHLESDVASARLVYLLGGEQLVERLLASRAARFQRLPSESLPLTEEVEQIFDRALVFATASIRSRSDGDRPGRTVHVRHLLAALFTDRRPLRAFEILGRAQRTRDGVLAQLCRWIYAYAGSTDDHTGWQAVFDELRDHIVPGYDNDEAHGEDCLSIGADVRGLAAVIASTSVQPPLSIGLFGDWGSGKSFFMTKLRERVAQLAGAARAKSGGDSWFCGQRGSVVQIDFNAWHYMDANLWSSLAVRVFDALNEDLKQEFARACIRELGSLKDRETELAAEHAKLVACGAALDDELARRRADRECREVTLAEYVEGVARAVVTKVAASPEVQVANRELGLSRDHGYRELRQVQADLGTVVGRVRRYWRTLSAVPRLVAFGLVVATPIATSLIVSYYTQIATGLASTAGALLATLGALYSCASRFAANVEHHLGPALDEVDRIEAEARAKQTAAERQGQAQRDETTARITELEREQLDIARRQGAVVAQLTALQNGDERSFKEFVLQRTAADDYRKHLGVVSSIHRDFTQLVEFLKPNDRPPNVERIILYIDDLDRCPPERVVEVLQAIHIILSLPLFVVVVGVDSRWLLDSLTTYYRRQFPIEGVAIDAARPQQYLEKIFQIPFTLSPMSPGGYSTLVGSLLERQREDAPVEIAATPAREAPGRDRNGAAAGELPDRVIARPSPSDASARIDITPRGLQLEPRERAYLKQLSSLVASPRETKRLVNLYRIVRCSLDDEALDRLINGRYRITQICLALVVGRPAFSAALFRRILSGELSSASDLRAWRPDADARTEPGAMDAGAFEVLGEFNRRIAEFDDWDAVRDAVRRVARFSFETGRVLRSRAREPERVATPIDHDVRDPDDDNGPDGD
jgi:hypothetical protein